MKTANVTVYANFYMIGENKVKHGSVSFYRTCLFYSTNWLRQGKVGGRGGNKTK